MSQDPTVITIEIPADFEGEATFTFEPAEPEPLPPNSPSSEGDEA